MIAPPVANHRAFRKRLAKQAPQSFAKTNLIADDIPVVDHHGNRLHGDPVARFTLGQLGFGTLALGNIPDHRPHAFSLTIGVFQKDGLQLHRKDRSVLADVFLLVDGRFAEGQNLLFDHLRFAGVPAFGRQIHKGFLFQLRAGIAQHVLKGLVEQLQVSRHIDQNKRIAHAFIECAISAGIFPAAALDGGQVAYIEHGNTDAGLLVVALHIKAIEPGVKLAAIGARKAKLLRVRLALPGHLLQEEIPTILAIRRNVTEKRLPRQLRALPAQ